METPELKIRAYAKLNLTLEILGKDSSCGLHFIRSKAVPISLSDRLYFYRATRATRRIVPFAPMFGGADEAYYRRNLVLRAAEEFLSATGKGFDISIALVKNIPVASGLGGGSSDAAATLKGLNYLCDLPLSLEDLLTLAAKLGSDVPFFIRGEPSLLEGFGERISAIEPVEEHYILAFPLTPLKTEAVYAEYDRLYESGVLPSESGNCLERAAEKILSEVYGGESRIIDDMKKKLLDAGAEKVSMSGSGGAVFGAYKDIRVRNRNLCELLKEYRGKGFHRRWHYLAASALIRAE